MNKNLYAFIKTIQKKNVEFTCSNFDDFDFSSITKNDFIYCDPPYLITTGTYNDGKRGFTGWGVSEEVKLLNLLTELNARGVRFALSNVIKHKGKTNDILTTWISDNNFNVIHVNKDYSNSNYRTINRDKLATDEVLITNYHPQKALALF